MTKIFHLLSHLKRNFHFHTLDKERNLNLAFQFSFLVLFQKAAANDKQFMLRNENNKKANDCDIFFPAPVI